MNLRRDDPSFRSSRETLFFFSSLFVTMFAVYGAVKRLVHPLRYGSKETSPTHSCGASLGANRRYRRRGFIARSSPRPLPVQKVARCVTMAHVRICACVSIDIRLLDRTRSENIACFYASEMGRFSFAFTSLISGYSCEEISVMIFFPRPFQIER